jgi:hypothetical protein
MNTKIALFVLAFLVFLSAHTADAQQPAKVYRIGVLSPRTGIEPRHEVSDNVCASLATSRAKTSSSSGGFGKANRIASTSM